jgi:hypothetical protein
MLYQAWGKALVFHVHGFASHMSSAVPKDPIFLEMPEAAPSWRSEALTVSRAKALEADWKDLARHAVEPNPFNCSWFVNPSIPLLEKLQPQIIMILSQNLLIGLFLVFRDTGYLKLPIAFWRTAMHHGQYLGTPLVRAGYEDIFAQGVLDWLDAAPRDHCFLKLSQLASGGKVAQALIARCEAQDRPFMPINGYERAAIHVPSVDPLAPVQHLSSGRRKALRRDRQGLMQHGPIVFERLMDKAQLPEWLDGFLKMENSGWKRDGGTSILSLPAEEAFYRTMVSEAFRQSTLHFFRLCVAGRPVAYTLDVVAGSHGYCLKSAFDYDYRKYAPGVLTEVESLTRYSQQDELHVVDSCTSPDNHLLNELWPNRLAITDLSISRSGVVYRAVFGMIRRLKMIQAGSQGG